MNEQDLIRIPLEFFAGAGAFRWRESEETRNWWKVLIDEGGAAAGEAADLLAQDAELAASHFYFGGCAVFRRPTLADKRATYTEGLRVVREQAKAEHAEAQRQGRPPRIIVNDDHVASTALSFLAEMAFVRTEGPGSERFATWSSLPDDAKLVLPERLGQNLLAICEMGAMVELSRSSETIVTVSPTSGGRTRYND
jgi:hypothetical protein